MSGEDGDGELVNDGRGDEWHENSKLKKLSHEVAHRFFSVWPGDPKRESSQASDCSGSV